MSGKGFKYEKARMDISADDIELPMVTAEVVDGDVNNLVFMAIFEKPSKNSRLGIIWDIVDNEIVLTGFDKEGLAITEPNDLEIGMTLISINGVSFVSGKIGQADEGVFLDEEEAGGLSSSMVGLVTEDTVCEASNIMRNAEGTLTIVARKNNAKRTNNRRKRTEERMRTMANRSTGSPPPPQGAPEGGIWGSALYYGPSSQLSSVLCCLVGGLIPATIMCCMPFDKRRVYFARNRYFGEFGGVISEGEESLRGFKQEEQLSSTYDTNVATTTCCAAFGVVVALTFILFILYG